ncbi:MAG: hypothetical protein ACLQAT_09110 [Candidatus Binataceae bacterium]
MRALLLEIDRALKSSLFTLAIMRSLVVPDICAALESADGKTNLNVFSD